MPVDSTEYPDELAAWVDKLEEYKRRLCQARTQAGDRSGGTVSERAVTDFMLVALASGTIGNVGYDLIKTALRAWRRPRVRLPEQARDMRDAVLIAMLATQARCAQVDLPTPTLQELEATECQRSPDGWRVELMRGGQHRYLYGDRPWPDGVALAASVLIPDGPLDHKDIQVTVVARRDADAAAQAELRRLKEALQQRRAT